MFKREMKVNFKNFIIWLSILIGIFLIVYLVYPSIIDSTDTQMIEEMMNMFPEDMLKAFNMDISTIDSAYGWLKSEGFVFVLLIIGCYSGLLGSNILLKEENDKTIEYLNSLPVKRTNIVLSKVLCAFIYIMLITLVLMIFNFICLKLSGTFDEKQFILLSLTPIFSGLVIFSICIFISTFTHKTKKMTGISLALVFISYIFQMISTLSEKTTDSSILFDKRVGIPEAWASIATTGNPSYKEGIKNTSKAEYIFSVLFTALIRMILSLLFLLSIYLFKSSDSSPSPTINK